MPTNRTAGFTLIELMITVVILSIIVGIAYPNYAQWMVQTRRSDAMIALTQAANQQERFFTECNWYAADLTGSPRACGTSTTGDLAFLGASPDGHYTLGLAAGSLAATCTAFTCGYTITATPGGLQTGDGAFRIDSRGVKQWDRNNDGVFDANEDSWTRR